MKALVYEAPESLAIRDQPEPTAGAGETVVDVACCGICGSDMHAYLGHDERRPPPLILGHEAAGTVRTGAMAGRRVTINPLAVCGTCAVCRSGRTNLCPDRQIISMRPRPGGFAERVAIPEANLIEIPADVPFERAALAEPIACGWHAVRLASQVLTRPLKDAACLVIGGGPIGLGAALVLRALGVSRLAVAEPHPARRRMLRDLEHLDAFDPNERQPDSADLVIDAVGYAATRSAASEVVKTGGVIAHIGLGAAEGGLNVRRMTLHEITFIGTFTYTAQDFRETAQAIFDGRLGELAWVEPRPLEDGPAAFAALHRGEIAIPKITLFP